MTSVQELNPTALIPGARLILMAAFAMTLVKATRGMMDMHLCFERLAIALLGLTFFQEGAKALSLISDELSIFISHLGDREQIKNLILDSLQKASEDPIFGSTKKGFNFSGLIEQAWRTGVWGVMTLIVEFGYVLASFLLECARSLFWMLLLFLFPLASALFPVFPRMMSNLALYAVELSLWFPMLNLVEISSGIVARQYMNKAGSLGLYVVAIEIIALLMILLIPSLTHRFMTGAFSGDFESGQSMVQLGKRAVMALKMRSLGI